jgi:glycosyltransferase involved in cell wall biosynthesis
MRQGGDAGARHDAARATLSDVSATAQAGAPHPPDPVVSVVVPTRNEAPNVRRLLERLACSQRGTPTEVLFVDDSDDDTPRVVRAAARDAAPELSVRLLHRAPGERHGGLGGAVVQGLRTARGPWVCVMDADLQHPPELIGQLLETAMGEDATLVVASRYRDGGSHRGLSSRARRCLSRTSSGVVKLLFPRMLRAVTDPMSGFFLLRRSAIDVETLKPDGFKILLELMVRVQGLQIAEVPFEFAPRHGGTSKAGAREGVRFLRHFMRLRAGSLRASLIARRRTLHFYDIHGIVTVESDARLPELESFRVDGFDRIPDIIVTIDKMPPRSSACDPEDPRVASMQFADCGRWGFAADIEVCDRVDVTASRLLARSPHVLYTNVVEPILRWRFVEQGYALVHGACVVKDGDAFVITARTDTGKTTTMLKLLDAHPYAFVSDDLTIVARGGRVLPYPKPLTISNHTVHAVQHPRLSRRQRLTLPLQSRLHSRSGRRFAFLLSRLRLPAASLNAVVQLVIPPPKYPVDALVPGVQIAETAQLAGLVVIQRGCEGFEWLQDEDALEILLANTEDAYGFPPYHTIENFLLRSASEDLRAREREIMADALHGRPAVLLSSTSLDWAARIPDFIERTPLDLRRMARSSVESAPTNGHHPARRSNGSTPASPPVSAASAESPTPSSRLGSIADDS